MCKVADGSKMFTCSHRFVGMGFGFLCYHCGHFRHELALDTKKVLLFFPSSKIVPASQTD